MVLRFCFNIERKPRVVRNRKLGLKTRAFLSLNYPINVLTTEGREIIIDFIVSRFNDSNVSLRNILVDNVQAQWPSG